VGQSQSKAPYVDYIKLIKYLCKNRERILFKVSKVKEN